MHTRPGGAAWPCANHSAQEPARCPQLATLTSRAAQSGERGALRLHAAQFAGGYSLAVRRCCAPAPTGSSPETKTCSPCKGLIQSSHLLRSSHASCLDPAPRNPSAKRDLRGPGRRRLLVRRRPQRPLRPGRAGYGLPAVQPGQCRRRGQSEKLPEQAMNSTKEQFASPDIPCRRPRHV